MTSRHYSIIHDSFLRRQVFRMDKTTHRPTNDPEAIEKFKKKLKKIVADQVRARLHARTTTV